MTHPSLSFEQTPPLDVPLRFLLTAPWFGVAAGLLIAWHGEIVLASRWTPQALALTHLLVAGYLLQAMSGALFQFLPVAAGSNVWRPRLLAAFVHPAYALAVVLLVAGFLTGEGYWLRAAAGLFLAVVLLKAVIISVALWRTPAHSASIAALCLAVAGLGVTMILGVLLAEALAGEHHWPVFELTNAHAAWGLGGWALMLVIGVSYFVVPMFQLTPQYPKVFARWVLPLLAGALILWSAQLLMPESVWPQIGGLVGLAVACWYAGSTLWLQQHRRRQVVDATLLFFRGAMVCLLAACGLGMAMILLPQLSAQTAWALGVLMIAGVLVSLVNGMAYKIVPFLCWLHLKRRASVGSKVPNMRQILGETVQIWQMRLHFISISLLLAGVAWPGMARAGGLAFAGACAWLGWNLASAMWRYRHFRNAVCA